MLSGVCTFTLRDYLTTVREYVIINMTAAGKKCGIKETLKSVAWNENLYICYEMDTSLRKLTYILL